MTDMTHTESGTKKEVLPDHFTIDLIKSIARCLISRGIPNRQAIVAAQEVVNELTRQYKGEQFYLTKKVCRLTLFLESTLNESLQKIGIATIPAGKFSTAVIEDISLEYKGAAFYIPFNSVVDRPDIITRDKLIVATYLKNPTYATIRQLSHDHNISIRRIYKIIKNPKRQSGRKPVSERDASILAEYQKEPTRETIKRLADEHGLKAGYTYHIIWRMMKQHEGTQNV